MIIDLNYVKIFGMKYADSPDNAWRIPLLKELLLARTNHLLINDFDNVALSDMINAVCTT